MTDTVMVEAALFQLQTAMSSIDEPMFATQIRLAMDVLANSIAAATQSLSPAAVNDVEFALNDVVAVVGEFNAADADAVTPALETMQADLKNLKDAMSLPPLVITAVRALQSKLKIRRTAIERQTYRAEGAPEEPIPHAPADLSKEAVPLRKQLANAGFATPALDALIADPDSVRFHSLGEIIDELDVIIG